MSSDRDAELGLALRGLPTPDHDPAFWAELDDRLGGVDPMESAPRHARRFAPRGLWLLSAAAAVVAMVVAAVAITDAGTGTRVRVTPPATTPQTLPWTKVSDAPLSGRWGHAAVWTGSEMVVWGGSDVNGMPVDDGARYDPAEDRWEAMAASPTGPLFGPTAVWTGTQALVWGSREGQGETGGDATAMGARYDPATDTWSPMSPSPLRGVGQSMVWTGELMLVWGGSAGETPVAEGAAYDPETDTWTPTARPPIDARFDHTAVWTGDRMIVWGGFSGEESPSRGAFADGAAYDPDSDSWTPIPDALLAPRAMHVAVWTGSAMVVWGGSASTGLVADGAAFDPAGGSWTVLPPAPLTARMFATGVAARGSMLVWGGDTQSGTADGGAAYDPGAAAWRALPDGPLVARARHSAVWTGTAMLVWGGVQGQAVRSDGAALRPPAPGTPTAAPPATPVPGTTPTTLRPSTQAPPATQVATPCADVVFSPNSENMAGDVVAEGLPCSDAEAFIRSVGGPLGPVNGPARVEKEGFVCVRTSRGDDGLPTSVYECTSGAKRITFVRT